jgi:hypothetical protein
MSYTAHEYAEMAAQANAQGKLLQVVDKNLVLVDPPVPSLENVKAEIIDRLKQQRDTLETSPVTHDGHVYDYDEKAIMRIAAARGAMQRNGILSVAWTTADNQNITVTADDLNAIDDAAAVRSMWLHGRYNSAKTAIQAAQTAKEVTEIAARAFTQE